MILWLVVKDLADKHLVYYTIFIVPASSWQRPHDTTCISSRSAPENVAQFAFISANSNGPLTSTMRHTHKTVMRSPDSAYSQKCRERPSFLSPSPPQPRDTRIVERRRGRDREIRRKRLFGHLYSTATFEAAAAAARLNSLSLAISVNILLGSIRQAELSRVPDGRLFDGNVYPLVRRVLARAVERERSVMKIH